MTWTGFIFLEPKQTVSELLLLKQRLYYAIDVIQAGASKRLDEQQNGVSARAWLNEFLCCHMKNQLVLDFMRTAVEVAERKAKIDEVVAVVTSPFHEGQLVFRRVPTRKNERDDEVK